MKSGLPQVTSEERTNQIQKTIIKKVNLIYVRRLFFVLVELFRHACTYFLFLFVFMFFRKRPKCAVTSRKRPLIVSTCLHGTTLDKQNSRTFQRLFKTSHGFQGLRFMQ